MAYPTPVNGQITDTVSQSTLMSVGTAGSVARSVITQGFAAAMAASGQNSTAQQEATQILADAALTAALARMETGDGDD